MDPLYMENRVVSPKSWEMFQSLSNQSLQQTRRWHHTTTDVPTCLSLMLNERIVDHGTPYVEEVCWIPSIGSYLLSEMQQLFKKLGGAWVAQSVERLTLAQVMISQFVSSRPTSGSVLTARSLEPASDSASLSLSAPPHSCSVSLSLSLSLSLSQK